MFLEDETKQKIAKLMALLGMGAQGAQTMLGQMIDPQTPMAAKMRQSALPIGLTALGGPAAGVPAAAANLGVNMGISQVPAGDASVLQALVGMKDPKRALAAVAARVSQAMAGKGPVKFMPEYPDFNPASGVIPPRVWEKDLTKIQPTTGEYALRSMTKKTTFSFDEALELVRQAGVVGKEGVPASFFKHTGESPSMMTKSTININDIARLIVHRTNSKNFSRTNVESIFRKLGLSSKSVDWKRVLQ